MAALTQVSQNFFDKYGKFFLVRHGKHRMKTFQAVLQDLGKALHAGYHRVDSSSAAVASFKIHKLPAQPCKCMQHLTSDSQ